jgi:N-acetylglucosaminyl-diphospho-decaprenol L-rhamnosyltransferase
VPDASRNGTATVVPEGSRRSDTATDGRPTVDVVVVAYNSRDTLRSCINPLVRLPWASVTVVDNACPEHSSEEVSDLPARVIESARNGGFAYGCNLGAAAGSAEFVLLLNPDAQIDAAGVEALVDALGADPRLAAVGPRTVDESGRLLFTQRRFPRLRSTYAQALFLHRAAPLAAWSDDAVRDPAAYERPGTPQWVSGCCVLLRRSAFESASGLDEGFFLYAEETDLFRRLTASGWAVGFEPRAVASHLGQGSESPDATEHFRAYSRVRYARKHHGAVVALLEAAGLALSALTHALAWISHPSRARGHFTAARAALRATRSVGDTL